jgi:hypothetical protein
MRHPMNDQPQRLPNGQWRCERGSGYGGAEWCSRPAAWVIEGLSPASRGAILCAEHYTDRVPSSVRYVPLDNPAPPSAPSPRDEGRAREALREIDALASELEVQAHNEGVECERGGPHEATPKAARKALLDAVARALSPSLGTAPNSSNEEK